jgi:hypothetical protein
MLPEDVGEAISLAANAVMLGSTGNGVRGGSDGIHLADSVNGWRNVARVSSPRNTVASLILAAYYKLGNAAAEKRHPASDQLDKIKAKDAATLLRDAEAAIRDRDQGRVCALVHRYGELGHPPRPVFDMLLKYAVSEDGKLHAEKYYQAMSEEFAATRSAFRWAAPGSPGPRHRQRVRHPGAGV